MKDRKKIILITLLIVFVLITVLVIFLSLKNDENKGTINNNGNNNVNNNNGSNTNENNETAFKKVDNYTEFFAIQNTINNEGELNTSYVVTELYLSKNSSIKYYFVNCSKLKSNISAETIDYTKNVYYMIIVNNSNSYELIEITDNVDDLYSYAKTYKIKNREINSNNKLKSGSTSTENILTIYIEYFKDMLILDTELAYNMLNENTSEKYINYTNFYNQVIETYNNLSSKIFSYSTKTENNKRVYYIEDNNRNKIVIYEDSIMNFKISY